ncbi:hypothetical protein [Bradyrhizobium sp. Ash2021]|uniref:hypothetical protein n=1 Tax=Bradyrhizobium sp. Ash2021 TaxID=2954771 RepID=UPI00281631C5|nr:hypothetical protein [Bradyrhizobium sp. Ash2021]WMT71081.1 hypothetical protein NL528_23540 [Bradyrhizobium sp. Ash2021]
MAERIIIWQKDNATMMSSWTDTVVFTKRKDGTFSIRHFSMGDEYKFMAAGKTSMKTAQELSYGPKLVTA